MNKSSTRVVFLSIVSLLSIALITVPNAYAEVSVKSFALEETTILEVVNESNEEFNTFRIWLGSGFSFMSFKTEEGWVGEKTPQGVIVFTSTEPIKSGESVKFGVKTDNAKPGINWKALDNDKQLNAGKVLPSELPMIENIPPKQEQIPPKQEQTPENTESMTAASSFRIVPEKPNAGSSIRITGDNFGASQEFDFYIDSEKLGSFETDEMGHFMTTMKIPDNQEADRVDFIVKDMNGEEKKISHRIGEVENRIPEVEDIKLTIKGLPQVIHRGDRLEISGTGAPNSVVTGETTDPNGEIINTRTADVDSKGNWKLDPIIVAADAELGEYSATITDGREELVKQWKVESYKKIIITPNSLKYEPGELMKFNGTALPNKSIELVLEDPLGKEVISDILQTNSSGLVKFEFQTERNTIKGTYTLIATQETDKELIFVGLGQLPDIPIKFEFDKLSYKEGETATISLSGDSSEIVSLLVLNPSDKPKVNSTSIKLQPDGIATYILDLDGYASGVYSAIISKGTTKTTQKFTVGLQIGVDEITINTTKDEYRPGEPILILGYTGGKAKDDEKVPNVLLTMTLIDPDGRGVRSIETFSNKEGNIFEESLRIPADGKFGTWTISAKSGTTVNNVEIDVLATMEEGISVSVTKNNDPDTELYGQFIFKVIGAQQTVTGIVIGEDGRIIDDKAISFQATGEGKLKQLWPVPKDTPPGTYTIQVKDAFNSANYTFNIQ